MIPEVGIHYDVPFAEYLKWDAWDYSFLKSAEHSLNYAWSRKQRGEADDEDKIHYSKGRLFHCLVGQPSLVDEDFVLKPETYTHEKGDERKWNGTANVCKAWIAAQAGRTIIDRKTLDEAAAMAHRVCEYPAIAKMLANCKVEVSIVWKDKLTGALCKARYDLFQGGIVVDMKSTSKSAAPGPVPGVAGPFDYEAERYHYHLQCAMYIDGGKALGMFGKKVPWFRFVVVESYFPHEMAVYDVQDDPATASYEYLCYGRFKYQKILQQVVYCHKNNEWPGYGSLPVDKVLTFKASKEMEEGQGNMR